MLTRRIFKLFSYTLAQLHDSRINLKGRGPDLAKEDASQVTA